MKPATKTHVACLALLVLAVAACGGETSDGTGDGGGVEGGVASDDDCANGFPERGGPCHVEGKICIEEAAECPVGVLVCRGGQLVFDHDGCQDCTSPVSGQSCTSCTPLVACECNGGGWSCASERDAGPDASDAGPNDAGDAG